MINPFRPGDIKEFRRKVRTSDLAEFESGEVHPFYGTFALTRDAEWSGRLFVLEMKEEDEEGIGTFVNIRHRSPALEGEEVLFAARLTSVEGAKVNCSFVASVGNRIIAEGETGQMILKKEKLEQIKAKLNG